MEFQNRLSSKTMIAIKITGNNQQADETADMYCKIFIQSHSDSKYMIAGNTAFNFTVS